MINRIVPGVGSVDRVIEREQVNPAKQSRKRASQQLAKIGEITAAEAVDVGDELNLVSHVDGRWADAEKRRRRRQLERGRASTRSRW